MFDGDTYEPQYDYQRLDKLLGRVWRFMADGKWHTLQQIQAACGGSEASCSARLRDFRKERFGGYIIEHRRDKNKHGGLWWYRMLVPEPAEGVLFT